MWSVNLPEIRLFMFRVKNCNDEYRYEAFSFKTFSSETFSCSFQELIHNNRSSDKSESTLPESKPVASTIPRSNDFSRLVYCITKSHMHIGPYFSFTLSPNRNQVFSPLFPPKVLVWMFLHFVNLTKDRSRATACFAKGFTNTAGLLPDST